MFKAEWEKTGVTHQLSEGIVEKMMQRAYPDKKLISYKSIAGGCANLNIKILLEDENCPLILRVYLRDKKAAVREQKLGAWLKHDVPVPLVYYIGEVDGYCFAITEFMPGITLRDLLLSTFPHDVNSIMYKVGNMLSKITSHIFPTGGFFDANLNIISFSTEDDVIAFVKQCLQSGAVLSIFEQDTIQKIKDFLNKFWPIFLDNKESHLVHGDFDPANILVSQINGAWEITGILDWEFAFSGSVLWDVANMLRYAHKMPPEFQDAFVNGLISDGIILFSNWRDKVNLLNLSSLLDCLKKSDFKNHPNRCADIRELIDHILLE